jgi:hypothetical protein
MGQDRKQDARGGRTLLIVLAVAMLPALYILAVGPFNWLIIHGYINPDGPLGKFLVIAYQPLVWISAHGGPIGKLLMWYISLWIT